MANFYSRELSIIKNMHLSTLNLGLWWESDIIDVLKFLHYDVGMSEQMMRDFVVSPPQCSLCPADMEEGDECTHDWRTRNKPAQGIFLLSA